jgi:hypothetical protein
LHKVSEWMAKYYLKAARSMSIAPAVVAVIFASLS